MEMPIWTWSEKPVEPITHEYVREQALVMAVQFATSRPRFNSHDVIDIAQEFLNWLNNVEV